MGEVPIFFNEPVLMTRVAEDGVPVQTRAVPVQRVLAYIFLPACVLLMWLLAGGHSTIINLIKTVTGAITFACTTPVCSCTDIIVG